MMNERSFVLDAPTPAPSKMIMPPTPIKASSLRTFQARLQFKVDDEDSYLIEGWQFVEGSPSRPAHSSRHAEEFVLVEHPDDDDDGHLIGNMEKEKLHAVPLSQFWLFRLSEALH